MGNVGNVGIIGNLLPPVIPAEGPVAESKMGATRSSIAIVSIRENAIREWEPIGPKAN